MKNPIITIWTPWGLNNHKVSFGSMTKRVVSHFDRNTITFDTKCDQITVYWTYLAHFDPFWEKSWVIQWKKWSENIILINITIFWEWNMPNHVSLHEETEFKGDRYESFVCITSFCDWTTTGVFSFPHSTVSYCTPSR